MTVIDCSENFKAFQAKIGLWIKKATRGNYAMFPELNSHLDETDITIIAKDPLHEAITEHLSVLQEEICRYFPTLNDVGVYNELIRNPFNFDVEMLPTDELVVQEEFIELINDGSAKVKFKEVFTTEFSVAMAESYPHLSKMVL